MLRFALEPCSVAPYLHCVSAEFLRKLLIFLIWKVFYARSKHLHSESPGAESGEELLNALTS